MTSHFDKDRTLNGVEQDQRLLPALEESYFNVDEMSFEDLLTLSVEFASSLTYYNASLKPAGDWKSFLASNEIVIMACIINKNIDEMRRQVQMPENRGALALSRIVVEAIRELDRWLGDLQRSSSAPAKELVVKLNSIIRSSLLEELHNIGATLDDLRELNPALPDFEFHTLSDIWEVGIEDEASKRAWFPHAQTETAENEAMAADLLRRSAFEFFNALEHLKSVCKSLLPQSLKTQSHDPAVSLFITFLRLYRYAQENVNTFTQRHLEFYYHELLKVHYKEKSLESATLNFSVQPGSRSVSVRAGSRFVCARDEALREVVFTANEDLEVSDAEITQVYTLKYDREPMITPECDMHFVTRVHQQQIPLHAAEQSGDGESWPLFGDLRAGRSAARTADSTFDLGIAVASRTLFLEEGYRKISLEVGLKRVTRPISSFLEDLEQSRSRAEFRQVLFKLMLTWIALHSRRDWNSSVAPDLIAKIESTALALDLKDPPSVVSATSGAVMQVESCESLFRSAVKEMQGANDMAVAYYKHLLGSESADEFQFRLGALVINILLENGSARQLLEGLADNKARELGCENSLETIKKELQLGKERLFRKYFDRAFVLDLSVETGWLTIDRYDVIEGTTTGTGFQIIASLPADAPSVVGCQKELHGDGWGTELPLMKLRLNSEATINIYSILERFCLDTINVSVDVTGVRNVVAFNSISQLDPSKPFFPFGPLPTTSSYLAISAPEAARKKIDRFRVHLYWGDLPRTEDGFDGHYAGYPSKIRNQSFTANVSILSNGSWQPQSHSQIQNARLFSAVDKKLKEHQVIEVESVELFKPVSLELGDGELDLGLKTRNGFLKLALASPDAAFGHNEYPLRLTETLESNAKARPKKRKTLPKPPYTPMLNKLSVDYSASSTLAMNASNTRQAEKHAEKVFRLHPFGAEQVYPNVSGAALSFFKPFDYDGNLLLGLSARNHKGLLSVYFSLADDSERSNTEGEIRHHWSYLTSTGWARLSPDAIVNDGTKGFLCSGIVVLDLPEDLAYEYSDMPGNCAWLKISSNEESRNFCSLRNVKTHAVQLTRSADDRAEFDPKAAVWEELEWKSQSTIPGLQSIRQLDGFANIGMAEKRSELITRVSERIRHRGRAVTAWDYERLILERFPFVGKVLCLPNRSKLVAGKRPGNLLIIVTPLVMDAHRVIGKTPKLSAVHLQDIHDYVKAHSTAFNTIEVTNPSYEHVQVRCTATFEDYASSGLYIDRLNDDISRYLNPWEDAGYGLNFCQTIKREDLYSYIYNLDYIKFVTDFSMLHITRDNRGHYDLGDTVFNELVEGKSADVHPLYPWSLMVPLQRHYIEVAKEIEPIAPEITGIRKLEIGSTFIVGGI